MTDLTPDAFAKTATLALKAFALSGLLLVAGCARPIASAQPNDPFEKENRAMHAFNIGLDRKVLKPVSASIGGTGRGPVATGLNNFVDNLDTPRDVVNDILQLRIGKAVHNSLRFFVNSTVGLGGIFDPATAAGVLAKPTDFGETLYVWGVGEGHYMELPVFGPSTARDAAGKVVDFALNPLSPLIKAPESYAVSTARVGDVVAARARHGETIDSILYGSADSYVQSRLLYLQNRRYELGQQAPDAAAIDPYEDPYGK
jgi:phospholipid-binding lipoprotein MlaA